MVGADVEAGGAQAVVGLLQEIKQRELLAAQVLNATNRNMDQPDDEQRHHEDKPVHGHGQNQREEQVDHQRPEYHVEIDAGEVFDG